MNWKTLLSERRTGNYKKDPVSSLEIDETGETLAAKKMGFFAAEQEIYEQVARECGTMGCRHPLTFILEAADDIAYRTADIEDAYKKGCISYQILHEEMEQYLRPWYPEGEIYPLQVLERQYQKALDRHDSEPVQYAISNFAVRMQGYLIGCATEGFAEHYQEIMEGSWNHDLFYGTRGAALCDALGRIAYDHAFVSTPILRLEVAAGKILDYFLEAFTGAFLYYDTDVKQGVMEEKLVGIMSEHYRQLYHYYAKGKTEAEKLYLRILMVTDYVSGMTDTYARDTYRELNGI
ncbi:MAG: deoxyguanosinetriphosphate triphosphohydrolase [Lachnospiraceae bacterium]|nr:deoxyguanosinetriphosphate triphosphohydrolase [Lachnospiraceae bacterium]